MSGSDNWYSDQAKKPAPPAPPKDWRKGYAEEMERVRRPRRRADRGGRGGPVQIADLLPEDLLKDIEAAKKRREAEGG